MLSHAALAPLPVVLVDDDEEILQLVRRILARAEIGPVITFTHGKDLLPFLAQQEVGVVVLDLNLPDISGLHLLPEINQRHPDLPVILFTATQDLNLAVACMKLGATDFLVKPVEEMRLVSCITNALRMVSLHSQLLTLKQDMLAENCGNADFFAHIITGSRRMWSIFRYILAVSRSREPVLVTGETGVGKELIARAIHAASCVKGEMIAINVAGLDDHTFTDTLFGHTKGAFTGADAPRDGLIARAAHGTLFLDEIGDLSPSSQIKLLRLLQENAYYPLGADNMRPATARILLATNRNLPPLIENGSFRADLFYRLSVHAIHVPPLRERREDLPLLLNFFLVEAAQALGKPIPTPPKELFSLLHAYDFPGNVRELRALVFDAVAKHRSRVLSMAHFQNILTNTNPIPLLPQATGDPSGKRVLVNYQGRLPTLKEAEQNLIDEAMRRANGNQGVAATLLGISRQALNRRLNQSPLDQAS